VPIMFVVPPHKHEARRRRGSLKVSDKRLEHERPPAPGGRMQVNERIVPLGDHTLQMIDVHGERWTGCRTFSRHGGMEGLSTKTRAPVFSRGRGGTRARETAV